MKKSLLVLFLIVFIVPSVALASWYNPFSWEIWNNIFHKKEITPQTQVINQPINTEPIDNSTITTSMKKEVKNDTPVVDNSNTQKKEVQAKIDAELKAKAERDVLISKQKLEEQTKLEAEQKAKAEQDALAQLSINNIIIDSTENSAKISWETNISSESKVILNGHEYISENGVGTTHQVNINGLDGDSSFNGSITAISNNAWKNQDFQFTTKHSPLAFIYHNGSCGASLCNVSWSTNNQSTGMVEVYSLGNLVGSFNSESGISKTHKVEFHYIGGTLLFKIKAVSGGESIETTVGFNPNSA